MAGHVFRLPCQHQIQRILRSVCFVVLVTVLATVAQAQKIGVRWNWLTPYPTGSALTDVVFTNSGTVLVCGQDNLLIRSVDAGSTWSPVVNSHNVVHLAASENHVVWAQTADGNVLRSMADGDSWTQVDVGSTINATCIAARNAHIVVGGTADATAYSTDNGNSWNAVTLPLLGSAVNVAVDNAGIFYVQNLQGLVFSFTSADDVRKYSPPFVGTFRGFTVTADGVMAMGSDSKGVFTWTPSDAFWQFATVPVTEPVVCIEGFANSTIIAGTQPGRILRSADNGKVFDSDSVFAPLFIQAAAESPMGGIVAVGRNGLILVGSISSSAWTSPANRSLSMITAVHMSAAGTLITGSSDGSMQIKTAADSLWRHVESPVTQPIYSITSHGTSPIFMGTTQSTSSNGIYVSHNGGKSWQELTSPDLASVPSFKFLQAVSDRCLYGAAQGKLYRSLDTGATWNLVEVIVDGIPLTVGDLLDASSESVLWCSVYADSNIYRTTDGGVNWTRIQHTGFGKPLFLTAAGSDTVCTGSNVSFNVRYGTTGWIRSAETASPEDVADFSSNQTLAVYSESSLYLRRPTDDRFTRFSIPLDDLPQRFSVPKAILWTDNSHVIVSAGYGGLLQATLTTISGIAEPQAPSHLPIVVELRSGAGKLFTEYSGMVRLYDASGRMVSTGDLTPETHRVLLRTASTLPIGLYQLQAMPELGGLGNSVGMQALGYVLLW